jgi:hypothetical protein
MTAAHSRPLDRRQRHVRILVVDLGALMN